LIAHVIDGVHILPVLHERLEYAGCVRRTAEELRPDAIVVEIPSSLEQAWLRAVDRLPSISVLLYETAEGRTIYLPIHPGDPFVEAARLARERELPLACADLDVDGYADYRDPIPDAYTVVRLGLPAVYRTFNTIQRRRDTDDDRRESSMAYHAKQFVAEGARTVLLVCGMHHARGVARQLQFDQATPLTPPVRRNLRLVHLHPESVGEVLFDIPFYVAAYESSRNGLPPVVEGRPAQSPWKQYGPFQVLSGSPLDDGDRLEAAVARAARNAASAEPSGSAGAIDRLKLQWSLVREAELALTAAAPDEEVRPWQRINLARFSRNLALGSGQLVADLFDLVSAARGCVSENFAFELYRLAIGFPGQTQTAADLPTARIRADEMFDGVRRIRLERRIRRPKKPDWSGLFRRRRQKERWPGEWLEGFDDASICSYPPEDIIVEEFGRYLRRRGKSILSEEKSRTVPFTTSVLDGIDVRETIRHWSEKKIFVRELGRTPGEVGTVVAVFDDDESKYPHCQTWLGEHNQESDMAFYCTEPTDGIVGPGICRVTYGGFVLAHPPRRMADIWTDADYVMAESRAEVLLLAALDYCSGNIVVHLSAKPPRSILHQLAGRLGLKILHVPIGTISPGTVKKIRVMHILSGHEKRALARDYIW